MERFDMEEQEFGSEQERREIAAQIKEWAENHPASDYPIVYFTNIERTMSPRDLAEEVESEFSQDPEEISALGMVMLDIIILESRKAKIPPIEYVKRMTKILRKSPGIPLKDRIRDERN